MLPSSSTAVLLFTRTPEEEARHKQFVSANCHVNRRIAHQLIKHTYSSIEKAGIPVFVINSDQQRGETFGERLTSAFEDVFERGYKNVIAVGNDTLTLTAKDIQRATELLEQNQAVIGPTDRGGTYLIGLSRSIFSGLDFQTLPWETDQLLDHLIQVLPIESTMLKCQRDINTSADFYAALTQLPRHSTLYKSLQSILFDLTIRRIDDRPRIHLKAVLRYYSHRAPPLLSVAAIA